MTMIGYTHGPDDGQLTAAGCEKVYTHWGECLAALGRRDKLVVVSLADAGWRLRRLRDVMAALERCGADLEVLAAGIDTSARGGRQMFALFTAAAEAEEALTEAARSRGHGGTRKGTGRPRILTDEQEAEIRNWRAAKVPVTEIVQRIYERYGVTVSEDTVYRALLGPMTEGGE
jgi:DNA invertase Pin-like site-specific DNA recombinase